MILRECVGSSLKHCSRHRALDVTSGEAINGSVRIHLVLAATSSGWQTVPGQRQLHGITRSKGLFARQRVRMVLPHQVSPKRTNFSTNASMALFCMNLLAIFLHFILIR